MRDSPDHGGGVDAAARQYGGARSSWVDLSTGINPVPYPVGVIARHAWTTLPDSTAEAELIRVARAFWGVPEGAAILAAPGASSLIARIPALATPGSVWVPGPTYNEHGRTFAASGWDVQPDRRATARVLVHPNNPDGRLWSMRDVTSGLCVIDESFCDVVPDQSLIAAATRPGVLMLKSFGKFWGLAGVRLGFAIGDPLLVGQLAQMLGPWPVSGPALQIGAQALADRDWADTTRTRLTHDAKQLDAMMVAAGATCSGGTTLFRLYDVDHAHRWQAALARRQIWTRVFPYSTRWLRLGLPGGPDDWMRLETALAEMESPR